MEDDQKKAKLRGGVAIVASFIIGIALGAGAAKQEAHEYPGLRKVTQTVAAEDIDDLGTFAGQFNKDPNKATENLPSGTFWLRDCSVILLGDAEVIPVVRVAVADGPFAGKIMWAMRVGIEGLAKVGG